MLTDIADSEVGTYTVVITNVYGCVTSTPASLVTVLPLIVTEPLSVTVTQGQSANFSVSVNGQTPFTYQWRLNGAPVPNATNSILSLANVQEAQAGNYDVVVHNPIGTEYSSVATLTVIVPPVITVPPANLIGAAGLPATFSVTATGTPLAYQWLLGGTNLPGATGATLTLNNVTTNSAGTYSVTVTNLAGSATGSATLTVYPTAVPVVALASANHQSTVSLTGVPTFNYAIQASSNLVTWVTLTNSVPPITFTTTNTVGQQFYRGKYLPPN
jgi:hypothetical protein